MELDCYALVLLLIYGFMLTFWVRMGYLNPMSAVLLDLMVTELLHNNRRPSSEQQAFVQLTTFV